MRLGVEDEVADGRSMRWLLAGLAIGLQLLHLLVLRLASHPELPSNYVQIATASLAIYVSLRERSRTADPIARRHWSAVVVAFAIWGLAQCLYLYFLRFPERVPSPGRPDDVLWVLFNLPLLLETIIPGENIDFVGWLDRLQVFLFFGLLSLLVFLPAVRLNMDISFAIQNFALAVCCVLRLPQCRNLRERRFFIRLSQFLLVCGTLYTSGNYLHTRGLPPGSLVDLVWTLPFTFFSVLTLKDEKVSAAPHKMPDRLISAARDTQGLGVALLAFLSIAVSALLTAHVPVLGGTLAFLTFALFALRTNSRERAWNQAHEGLQRTVLHDTLTGLGNRMMLRQCLEERLQHPTLGVDPVLVFADLDRFKAINDSLGHTLGDQLLIAVAQRLRAAAPEGSVVCRHGGDEFVLLTSASGAEEAIAIAEALSQATRPAYELHGHNLQCTASIGVMLANPGETADELLRTADQAMYRAKELGRNCVQFFDETLRTRISHRRQLEMELRRCLETGGLEVAFQPILTVESGAISGFEALARWHHPVLGNVTPVEFIPLAEESGLIVALGTQILEKACRQVALWNILWHTDLSLNVNVSPRQFADPHLLKTVLEVLSRTHLSPALLRLEITETALLVNQSLAKETLTAARAHGICISLDDFGTGYSSLAFLLNLPVDEVKVDRSFVSEMRSDPQRKELVKAVVQLGLSLGKRVVAEGVETEEDLRELAAMGCECAQGWHIGRPLSAEATEASLPFLAGLIRQVPATREAA